MAFANKSAVLAGHHNPITPGGPELVRARFGQSLVAADHVANTLGVIGILPAGCLPSEMFVRVPAALGAGFTASVGLANTAGTDISTASDDGGAAWATNDATGAAGGYVNVVPAAFSKIVPKDFDRQILLKIITPGTGTPAGVWALDLVYANA